MTRKILTQGRLQLLQVWTMFSFVALLLLGLRLNFHTYTIKYYQIFVTPTSPLHGGNVIVFRFIWGFDGFTRFYPLYNVCLVRI